MKDTILIYPNDPSTTFLLEPFEFLRDRCNNIAFFEIEPNENSHNKCIELIGQYNNVVFMGHGTHSKLNTAKSADFQRPHLLSMAEIQLLEPKNWLLFSCDSNDLIKKLSSDINSGIGFGKIPTDPLDVQEIMEMDASAFIITDQNIIEEYRKAINWIIIQSVLALSNENLNFRDLFNRLQIIIDRRMIDVLNEFKNANRREIAKLLYELKDQSILKYRYV